MEKKEVIKASGAIHMQGHAGLLQRKAWNILLANAYDDLSEKEAFEIKLSDLESSLGFNDRKMLIDMLTTLQDYTIEWNILKKEKKKIWSRAHMLGGITVSEGILSYNFDSNLKSNLINPAMYARISLMMQRALSGKYGLTIYELCTDYYDVHRGCGETPYIELNKYRELMGIDANEYKEFKFLNVRAIKDPIKEINEKTDLFVEAEYKREKKKVIAIKFRIRKKPEALLLPPAAGVPDLFTVTLTDKLEAFGISPNKAEEIVGRYDQALIEQWIECLNSNYIKGVTNKPGYLVTALQKGFNFPPTYTGRIKQKLMTDTQKEREDRRKNCPICKGEGGFYQDVVIDGTTYSSWENCNCVRG